MVQTRQLKSLPAADPGADRLYGWDDSTGLPAHFTAGSGLQIVGTELSATGGGVAVIVQEGDAEVEAAASVLDFDASDFAVTSSPSGEANIALAYGASAGTPAEGNHTHAAATGIPTVFNVKDAAYGATGDGTTDDTAAFAAAMTAASGGGRVYVPVGTYIITDITITSNIVLYGAGYNSVLKLKANTAGDVINSGAAAISFAIIENLRIDGNKANQTADTNAQQYGIVLGRSTQIASDCVVRNCWIHDTYRSGIYFFGPRNRAENNRLWNIGRLGPASSIIGRSGIVFDGANDGTNDGIESVAHNNRIPDCLEHGIKVYPGGERSQVTENIIGVCGDFGIWVAGADDPVISGNTVNGAVEVGIYLAVTALAGGAVTGNTVIGTTADPSTGGGTGILLNAADSVTVTGNNCRANALHGIWVFDSQEAIVTGNDVIDNTGTGILVSGTSNFAVIGPNGKFGNGTAQTIGGANSVVFSGDTETATLVSKTLTSPIINTPTPAIVTSLTAETTIAGGDLVMVYDDSAAALRKMTRTNFVAGLSGGASYPALASAVSIVEDFPAATTTSGSIGTHGWSLANGTAAAAASEAGRHGILNRAVSSIAYAPTVLALTTTTLNIAVADSWDVTFSFRANQNDTTEVRYRVGLASTGNLDAPTHGIYLEKVTADTNWFFVTRAANVQTRTDSGVAVAVAWAKIRIRRIDASTIGFTLNGGTEVTHTANIPSANQHLFFAVGNVTAVARSIDVDYVEMAITGLTR